MSVQTKRLFPIAFGEWKEHYQPLAIGILLHMRWRFRFEERSDSRDGTIQKLEASAKGRKWLQEAQEVGAHIAEQDGRTHIRTHAVYHDMQWTVREFGTMTREYFTAGETFGLAVLPDNKSIRFLRSRGRELSYELPFGGKMVRWGFGPGRKWMVRKGKHPFRRRLPTYVVVSFD